MSRKGSAKGDVNQTNSAFNLADGDTRVMKWSFERLCSGEISCTVYTSYNASFDKIRQTVCPVLSIVAPPSSWVFTSRESTDGPTFVTVPPNTDLVSQRYQSGKDITRDPTVYTVYDFLIDYTYLLADDYFPDGPSLTFRYNVGESGGRDVSCTVEQWEVPPGEIGGSDETIEHTSEDNRVVVADRSENAAVRLIG